MLHVPQAARRSSSLLEGHSFDNCLIWALVPPMVHPMRSLRVEFSVGKGKKPTATVGMALVRDFWRELWVTEIFLLWLLFHLDHCSVRLTEDQLSSGFRAKGGRGTKLRAPDGKGLQRVWKRLEWTVKNLTPCYIFISATAECSYLWSSPHLGLGLQ